MPRDIKRIALNTGGGDAPGLNAVISAVVRGALRRGWEVLGIRDGYAGLLDTSKIVPLGRESVRGIAHLGGTIIGTSSCGNPLEYPTRTSDGGMVAVDRCDEVVENFKRLGLDALITIGGDGSMRIAHALSKRGIPVVGIPKTIDNDLNGTLTTFGFDTAVTVATDAVDRLHTTAEAHQRVFTVEVMGRYAGWIALHSGIAGGADVILLPEIEFDIESICRKVGEREASGHHFAIVVVAEGARPVGGSLMTKGPKELGREVTLGGVAEQLAREIGIRTGKETRCVVLGHLQRGGRPTARDRLIALRFGAAAVRVVARGESSVMVALDPPNIRTVPLEVATSRMKSVPLDGDTLSTAREMGICIGDDWK